MTVRITLPLPGEPPVDLARERGAVAARLKNQIGRTGQRIAQDHMPGVAVDRVEGGGRRVISLRDCCGFVLRSGAVAHAGRHIVKVVP